MEKPRPTVGAPVGYLAVVLFGIAACGLPDTASVGIASQSLDTDQIYKIVNLSSQDVLDVQQNQLDNGALITQHVYLAAPDQQWRLLPQDDGSYAIQNVHSGRVLDVIGWSTDDDGGIQQYDWGGGANQEWNIVDQGNGYNALYNVYSGKTLNDPLASTADGQTMEQYTWIGAATQQWALVPVAQSPEAVAQNGYAPYGLDAEWDLWQSSGTAVADYYYQSHATWVRQLVPWGLIEANAPTGDRNPYVPGQYSGQHTYDWSTVDLFLTNAHSHGINVYMNMFWTPPWSNGNPYDTGTCTPFGGACPNGQYEQGRLPLDTNYLTDFTYALINHVNGVEQYYGVQNEPNLANNYNPYRQGLNNPNGNYLNYFMIYEVFPVVTGLQAVGDGRCGGTGCYLVGPDVSQNGCGIPSSGCDWIRAWVQPLSKYFGSTFSAWSVHIYRDDHTQIRNDMDAVHNAVPDGKPMWLSEFGIHYSIGAQNQATQLEDVFIDEHNRSYYWTRSFYHNVWGFGLPSNLDWGIVTDTSDPNTPTPRPAYTEYQTLAAENY